MQNLSFNEARWLSHPRPLLTSHPVTTAPLTASPLYPADIALQNLSFNEA